MASETRLPVGKIVKSTTTQEQSLFSMLEECRNDSFDGYIAVYFYNFDKYYEGDIILRDGRPTWAVANFDNRYVSDAGFNRILEDANATTCNIDLHVVDDIDAIVDGEPDGKLRSGEDSFVNTELWKMNEMVVMRKRIKTWKRGGWDTDDLEEVLGGTDIDQIRAEFDSFERNVSIMKDLRERLYLLDAEGFDEEKGDIEEILKHVNKTLVVRKRILALENKIMMRRKEDRRSDNKDEMARFGALMHYWRSMGYIIDRLETALRTENIEIIKTEFKLFERDITVLKEHRKIVEDIDTDTYQREKQNLLDKTYDPVNIPGLEKQVYYFGLKVASEGLSSRPTTKPQSKQVRPEPARRRTPPPAARKPAHRRPPQKKKAAAKPPRRRTKARPAPKGQSPSRPARDRPRKRKSPRIRNLMRSIGEGNTEVPADVILGEASKARLREGTVPNHFKRFTFDTFVVDETNRFTRAAAFAVAQTPGMTYNPLFIYSPSGLGKTHLLGAIHNRIRKSEPTLRQIYVTSEEFTSDVVQSMGMPNSGAMRKYDDADVLLIDDIQILAGKESAQEMFFHIFNNMHAEGKQIVITSDRPPKELRTLEKRMRTRFEGGLIADIQHPSLELRTAILIKKSSERGLPLKADVIEYVAANIRLSIRELEGALSKLHAEHTLKGKDIDLARATDLLKDYLTPDAEDMPQPTKVKRPETPEPAAAEVPGGLDWGFSYLLEVVQPDPAYKLFTQAIEESNGLLISRTNPRQLNHFYDLGNAEVLWLTDMSEGEGTISSVLEELMEVLMARIHSNERMVIMLDGIEYLVHIHGFDPVVNLIRRTKDSISEKEIIFLVPLSPKTLKPEECAVIERELHTIKGD